MLRTIVGLLSACDNMGHLSSAFQSRGVKRFGKGGTSHKEKNFIFIRASYVLLHFDYNQGVGGCSRYSTFIWRDLLGEAKGSEWTFWSCWLLGLVQHPGNNLVMELEDSEDGNMMGLKVTSRHKRSKSFGEKRMVNAGSFEGFFEASPRLKLDMGNLEETVEAKQKHSPNALPRNSLKREPATDLIKEIAVLELEVIHLEQYLLSLYRKAFDQQVSSVSPSAKSQIQNTTEMTPKRLFLDEVAVSSTPKTENASIFSRPRSFSNIWTERRSAEVEDKVLDSCVNRCYSSLSQRSALLTRNSPINSVYRVEPVCHSQQLSLMEYAQSATSNVITLAEHLGTNISHHVPETPNRISEDMVKCMSAIFVKLAEPPSMCNGMSSPNSSSSSIGGVSPHCPSDAWSLGFGKDSSIDTRLDNPFNVEGLKAFSGPYSTMIEVSCIYRETQKSGDVELLLQNFRSLIRRLQKIDPSKMKHEEKLAFWINVHNALVMHAFVAYGIPQNNVKRVFVLLKTAYNTGGQTVTADTIQSTILGCRMPRPGQWLRTLFFSSMKFKTRVERQAFAIEHPEPLLHFALCSGNHSDPALRVYTPKQLSLELEAAKEEYILKFVFAVSKDHKFVLPKLVESYARDASLSTASLVEVIQKSLPEPLRKSLKKWHPSKSRKNIDWIPHNFSFRYLIYKDLLHMRYYQFEKGLGFSGFEFLMVQWSSSLLVDIRLSNKRSSTRTQLFQNASTLFSLDIYVQRCEQFMHIRRDMNLK
ncbi:hypothetical protein AKJ16_DCAP23152, partial [Drosera capensis]